MRGGDGHVLVQHVRIYVKKVRRTRARSIQDRYESSAQKKTIRRHWRIPELAIGLVLMCGGAVGAILLSRYT